MALVTHAGDRGTRVTLYEAAIFPQCISCGSQTFETFVVLRAVETNSMLRTHKKPWLQSQHDQGTQRSCIQRQEWWGMRLDCEWKARLGYLVIFCYKQRNKTLLS